LQNRPQKAGYGKTTLVVQWQQQLTVPSAWLSADTSDNDLCQFLRNLVDSVRVVRPDACGKLLGLIRSPQEVAVARLAEHS
jgi:ATP/maltotriose-dependent transcriptional regulator MalT